MRNMRQCVQLTKKRTEPSEDVDGENASSTKRPTSQSNAKHKDIFVCVSDLQNEM